MIIEVDLIQNPELAVPILTLQRLAYQVESQLIDYPGLPPLSETIEDLQSSAEKFLIYEDAGVMIGVLSYRLSPGELEISRLVVHPDHFGRGVASALLEAVEAKASPSGQIYVSTAEKNLPAIALYHKCGYKTISCYVLPDGLTLVSLQKEIAR